MKLAEILFHQIVNWRLMHMSEIGTTIMMRSFWITRVTWHSLESVLLRGCLFHHVSFPSSWSIYMFHPDNPSKFYWTVSLSIKMVHLDESSKWILCFFLYLHFHPDKFSKQITKILFFWFNHMFDVNINYIKFYYLVSNKFTLKLF